MRLASPAPAVIEMVMANLRPNRSVDEKTGKVTRLKRCLLKGKPFRRVIAEATVGGVEHSYHATKGWRRHAVSA